MTLYDPEIAEIVKKGIPVEIEGKPYAVWSHRSGSCDGCAFERISKCPTMARRYCNSNGGNILKLVDNGNRV